MVTLTAGTVVLIRFPFSDLSQSKVRPALVLAEAGNDEWILCQITSNPYADARALPLSQVAFQSGGLHKDSFARPSKLFTAHVSLVSGRAGQLHPHQFRRVVEATINTLTESLTH